MKEREVVAKAAELLRAVRVLRKEYPRLELGQLEVILTVCTKPGIRGAEIAEGMDEISSKAVHKSVRILSSDGEASRPGLRLIDRLPDKDDARVKILVPTRRAWMIVQNMAMAMQGGRKAATVDQDRAAGVLLAALKEDKEDGTSEGKEVAGRPEGA